jgi:RHS repeat-associated protein
MRPNGTTIAVFYVHSDPLNTPRQVTRPSDNTLMWTWNSDPFGTDAANPNPAGAGTFAFNLRFPGQLFDGQAGLHYNGFRDYDPATGRYPQSDRLGLAAGSYSTYAYADGNPIWYTDPRGTDVRVYNGGQAGGLHQGISVDTPSGPYQVSYGLDHGGVAGTSQSGSDDPAAGATGTGIVYEDPFPPASVVDTLHTTPAQDRIIEQLLRQQVGNRGPYNLLTNNCRTYSQTQFNNIRDRFEGGSQWQRLLLTILGGAASPAY